MIEQSQILHFLENMERSDGSASLSEAKRAQLCDPDSIAAIVERDEILAVGVVAAHEQSDGPVHWSIETAVTPGMRFSEFEGSMLRATVDLLPKGAAYSVWSSRPSLTSALKAGDYRRVRKLAYMATELPIVAPGPDPAIREFTDDDYESVVAVNGTAFQDHREASALTVEDIVRASGEKWFDRSGFLLMDQDGEVAGFCWTKQHENGDGEIYRIAVMPAMQGRGAGRRLLLAGLGYLGDQRGIHRGTLWVDLAKETAVGLYESVGMQIIAVNTEFEPN